MIEIVPADTLAHAAENVESPGIIRWVWRQIRRSFDPAERFLLEGTASTAHPNVNGGILAIDGAVFSEEIPLLFHHQWCWPVGVARLRRASHCIEFTAELAMRLPGAAACWDGIVTGYAGCVSVGMDFMVRSHPEHLHFAPDVPCAYSLFRIAELSICSAGANPYAITYRRWREPRTPGPVTHSSQLETT